MSGRGGGGGGLFHQIPGVAFFNFLNRYSNFFCEIYLESYFHLTPIPLKIVWNLAVNFVS